MPRVVVIAGPNGAGKSTTAPPIVRKAFGIEEFVNADLIAQGLSVLAPETAAFRAGRVMLTRILELSGARRDFAFETTLASRTFAPLLRKLQADGYQFHLIYLWLPSASAAVRRVRERVRAGGHGVPEAIVRRRYARSLGNFLNLYRPFADSWLLLDNSGQPDPRAIAWRDVGGPLNWDKRGPWERLRRKYEKDVFKQT
jgi:predicted ABC-type ATPase